MPSQLKYIAQDVMDLFYQEYKMDSEFWTIDDFIGHTGDTISEIYNAYYQQMYKESLAEKKQEVVMFDAGILSSQVLKIQNVGGVLSAKLEEPVMSFLYDQSSTGVQVVSITKPYSDNQVERTTLQAKWQLQYLPQTNTIFFYVDRDILYFINKGNCNVSEVNVHYIPSMYPCAIIPDGIIDMAKTKVLKLLRELAQTVVKETNNQNHNKIIESEIDKTQLK
jgi:hypothetical protein